MRDCLVETHCWGKCDEEVQRFQECINTKYFEETVVEREVEASDETLEPGEVISIEEEVKAEGDESGDQSNDYNAKINQEPPVSNEEMKEDDTVQDEKPEEKSVETDAIRIKIVSKTEKEVQEDEDLLFKVSVKPNVS